MCNLRGLDWLVSDIHVIGFGIEKPCVEVSEYDFFTLRVKLPSREFLCYFIDHV